MLETWFWVGFEIGFFTKGCRLNGATIFFRIGGLVGIGGFFANGAGLN
jgi:hypothetical protein